MTSAIETHCLGMWQVGVKRGDRLWMMGFGTGFKCCSSVWVALRDIKQEHDCWK